MGNPAFGLKQSFSAFGSGLDEVAHFGMFWFDIDMKAEVLDHFAGGGSD